MALENTMVLVAQHRWGSEPAAQSQNCDALRNPRVGSSRLELLQTPLMCYILGVGSHLSVELTFPFYLAEMSLLLKKENILLLHCQVGTPVDPGVVPLAPPAQVCHRSGHDNEGHNSPHSLPKVDFPTCR